MPELQPHGDLRRPLGDDLLHLRPRGEELAHRRRLARGSDEIQVAHDLLAPPEAAALAGADDRRMRAQFVGERGAPRRPRRPGGKSRRFCARCSMAARSFCCVFSPKPGSSATRPSRQAASSSSMLGDAEFFVQRLDLLRAEAVDLEQLENARRETRPSSSSKYPSFPVWTSSAIFSAMDLPMPSIWSSSPLRRPASRSPV